MDQSVENVRYFVITAGRSGSTLLCSILADAGANFGLLAPDSWDETGGAFEHPSMWRAAKCYHDAYRISPYRPSWPRKWLWDLARWRGKRQLARALDKADFFKAIHIDLAVQPARKLGYFPRIIISFRPFADQVLSLSGMFSERTASCHEAEYLRTYQNALLWLQLYGGCVVSCDELTDMRCMDWVQALAETSGLSAEAIAAGRRNRVRPRTLLANNVRPQFGYATASLEKSLQSLCGVVIPPSYIARRAWLARRGQASVTNVENVSGDSQMASSSRR